MEQRPFGATLHFLETHWDEAEADWQRYYGRDLAADVWGEYRRPARWLDVRLRGLLGYHDSLLARKIAGDQADWNWTQELLACVFDAIQQQNFLFLSVNSKKPPKKPPAPFPRPWKKATASRSEVTAPPADLRRDKAAFDQMAAAFAARR